MSFPTNPTDGQIYKNHIYTTTTSSWKKIDNTNKPAFQAYGSANGGTTGQNWIFNNTHVNVGGCYSTSTGRFTVPVAGNYYFSWANIGNTANDVYRYIIKVNGIDFGGYELRIDTEAANGVIAEYGNSANRSIILSLNKDDYINIYFASDHGSVSYSSGQYPTFSGYLI